MVLWKKLEPGAFHMLLRWLHVDRGIPCAYPATKHPTKRTVRSTSPQRLDPSALLPFEMLEL